MYMMSQYGIPSSTANILLQQVQFIEISVKKIKGGLMPRREREYCDDDMIGGHAHFTAIEINA